MITSSCFDKALVNTFVFCSALFAFVRISDKEARSWVMSFLELFKSARKDWMTWSFSANCWLRNSTTFCSRSTPCEDFLLAKESWSIFILALWRARISAIPFRLAAICWRFSMTPSRPLLVKRIFSCTAILSKPVAIVANTPLSSSSCCVFALFSCMMESRSCM